MSDSKKLVSIIVPAYNVENYIDRCIESILAQTYSKIEVLVVDDGSTDKTWSHIEYFMNRDSRVRVFHRDNAGVSATRNFALSQATGYYLQFVDADDYLAEEATHTLVNAIETTGASWVNCQYTPVDESGVLTPKKKFINGLYVTDTQESRFKLVRDVLLEYKIGYEVWNKLFLTSVIEEHDLKFIENCSIGEDLAFNICYGFHADSIYCIDDKLYNYFLRSDSAMGNIKSLDKNMREHLVLVKGIENYFKNTFTEEISDKYYQIFYKLMLHASQGYTAEETLQAVKRIDDDYYFTYLSEALRHKKEFCRFCRRDLAKLYYRYTLYIKSHYMREYITVLKLKLYDLYRILRRRDTLTKWKLS